MDIQDIQDYGFLLAREWMSPFVISEMQWGRTSSPSPVSPPSVPGKPPVRPR